MTNEEFIKDIVGQFWFPKDYVSSIEISDNNELCIRVYANKRFIEKKNFNLLYNIAQNIRRENFNIRAISINKIGKIWSNYYDIQRMKNEGVDIVEFFRDRCY